MKVPPKKQTRAMHTEVVLHEAIQEYALLVQETAQVIMELTYAIRRHLAKLDELRSQDNPLSSERERTLVN